MGSRAVYYQNRTLYGVHTASISVSICSPAAGQHLPHIYSTYIPQYQYKGITVRDTLYLLLYDCRLRVLYSSRQRPSELSSILNLITLQMCDGVSRFNRHDAPWNGTPPSRHPWDIWNGTTDITNSTSSWFTSRPQPRGRIQRSIWLFGLKDPHLVPAYSPCAM